EVPRESEIARDSVPRGPRGDPRRHGLERRRPSHHPGRPRRHRASHARGPPVSRVLMARVLHVFKDALSPLAEAAIAEQIRAGDHVMIVALASAPAIPAPDGLVVQRVPTDLTYDALLE